MAIASDAQGQGIEKKILTGLEMHARQKGVATIVLYARENAVEFYRRNGYYIKEVGDLL